MDVEFGSGRVDGGEGSPRRHRAPWGAVAVVTGVVYLAARASLSRDGVDPALWWAAFGVEALGLVSVTVLLLALRHGGRAHHAAVADHAGDGDRAGVIAVDVVVRVDRQPAGRVIATLAGVRSGVDVASVTLLRFVDRDDLGEIADRFGVGLVDADRHDDDAGFATALSIGRAPFVAVIDAGDVPLPGFAEACARWAVDPDVAAVRAPVDSWALDSAEHDARGRHQLRFEREVLHPAASGWALLGGSGSLLRRSAVAAVGVPGGARRAVELRLSTRLHRSGMRIVAPAGPVVLSSQPLDVARAVARDRRRDTAATLALLAAKEGPLRARRLPAGARVAALAACVRPLSGIRRLAFLAVLTTVVLTAQLPAAGPWPLLLVLWAPAMLSRSRALRVASAGRLTGGDRARWSFATVGSAVAGLLGPGRSRPGGRARGGRRGGLGRIVGSRSVAVLLVWLVALAVLAPLSDLVSALGPDDSRLRVPPMPPAERAAVAAVVTWCLVVVLDVLRCLNSRRQVRAAARVPTDLPGSLDGMAAVVIDITPAGAGALVEGDFHVGEEVPFVVEVPSLDGSSTVRAVAAVRSVRRGDGGCLVGLELVSMDPASSHALYELCEVIHPAVVLAGGWAPADDASSASSVVVRAPRHPLVRATAIVGLLGVCAVTAPPFGDVDASGLEPPPSSVPATSVADRTTDDLTGPAVAVAVFDDRDGDGLQGDGEAGIGGVAVGLHLDEDANGLPEGSPVASDTTGAAGRQVLVAPRAGTYLVEARVDARVGAGSAGAVRTAPVVVTGDGATVAIGLRRVASIGGRVWDDADADGMPDGLRAGGGASGEYDDDRAAEKGEPESPMRSVLVRLRAAPAGTVLATVSTDADGRYAFGDVPHGSYSVEVVSPDGFVVSTGAPPAPFELAADVTELDVGLWRPVSIGDTVWHDLDDDGVAEPGEPGMAGIVVRLFAADGITEIATGPDGIVGSGDDRRGGVTTDRDGRYRFANLVPGTYRVGVLVPAGWRTSSRPDAGDANDDTDGDDNASPGPAAADGTPRLTGHVEVTAGQEPTTDGDGDTSSNRSVDIGLVRPVASLRVDVLVGGAATLRAPAGALVTTSYVVANTGTVALTDVMVGDGEPGAPAPDCNGGTEGDGRPMVLEPGEVRTCYARHVVDEGVTARTATVTAVGETAPGVTGPIGPVTAGAEVIGGDGGGAAIVTSVSLTDPGPSAAGVLAGRTVAPDGAAMGVPSVPDLTPVWWVHAVTNTGASTATVTVRDRTGTACSAVSVEAGATVWCATSEVLRRPADGAVVAGFGTVSVTDPATGAEAVSMTAPAPVLVPSPAVSVEAVVGPAGAPGLDAGSEAAWRYVVTNTGDWPLTSVIVVDDVHGTVGCPLPAGSSGLLAPGATLTCTAVGIVPGAPRPSGSALFAGLPTVVGAVVAPSVLAPVATPVSVVATPVPTTAGPSVAIGASAVSVVQPLVGSLGDRVWSDTDADGVQDEGEPGLAGVLVRLLDGSGVVVASTLTDRSGAYRFTGVDPGTYSVAVIAPAGHVVSPRGAGDGPMLDSDVDPVGMRTSPVVVAGGATVDGIDVGLFQPAVLGDAVWFDAEGAGDGVRDTGDGPVAGVVVRLFDRSGTVLATVRTDGRGRFEFPGLRPGGYVVAVDLPAGYEIANGMSVDRRTGQSDVVELASGERRALSVAIRQQRGGALAGGPLAGDPADGGARAGAVARLPAPEPGGGSLVVPAGLPSSPGEVLRLAVFAMAALVIVVLLTALRPVTSSLVPVAGFGVARLRSERTQSTT